jgi:hypothetical protein
MAEEKHEHLVRIKINDKTYEVPPGPTLVSKLKEIAGVPAADELEQVVDGKLEPLPDNGTVDVKDGDRFISHPRTGSSSD